jgi:hypothetical protein
MKSRIYVGLVCLVLTGCGNGLTHPVQGKVVLAEGNIEDFRDAYVEFELEGDSTVRGSGPIGADGRFRLERIHNGEVEPGLPAGKYRGRLLLADDGTAAKKSRALVPRRYLDFKTSGLTLTVPPHEEVVLHISGKK